MVFQSFGSFTSSQVLFFIRELYLCRIACFFFFFFFFYQTRVKPQFICATCIYIQRLPIEYQPPAGPMCPRSRDLPWRLSKPLALLILPRHHAATTTSPGHPSQPAQTSCNTRATTDLPQCNARGHCAHPEQADTFFTTSA